MDRKENLGAEMDFIVRINNEREIRIDKCMFWVDVFVFNMFLVRFFLLGRTAICRSNWI